MRVLFVTNSYPTVKSPGASPCIEQQKKALEKLGFDIDVLFFDGPKNRLNYIWAMARILLIVQIRNQYDLIHAHYGFCGIVARMQFRCPIVVTFRGSDVLSLREQPISRMVASHVDKVIIMTEEMKRLLGRKDASVIPYGIDLNFFKPCPQDAIRQELGLPLKTPLILFPYDSNRPEKRYDLVEQAIAILSKEYPDIQVLILHGKPQETVAAYMNACNAMVLTSNTEGAPVAIREAMACNLPIVSVDVGDVADVIRDTEGCYICEKNPDGIAAKLAQVLKAGKRTNGRQAAERFDLSKTAIEIASIYRGLFKESSSRLISKGIST